MGKFSWTPGHHKQASDKQHGLPGDWFSKFTSEPSRQALNDLVKEPLAVEFDSATISASSSRTRSRANTVSSVKSHYTKSSLDNLTGVRSRPESRQSMIEDAPRSPGRQEPVSRSLFSKGSRIMRRKTSKLKLLPSQIEEVPADNRRRNLDPSNLELATQLLNISPKRAPIKASISGPFAFQHVTHTDQGQFQSLSGATNTDLLSEFSALQAGQQPAPEIKGIAVDDLPSSPQHSEHRDDFQPQSPTRSAMVNLPITPPRPEPPPKDPLPAPSTPDIRLSRSVENFSRPTRSPVFGSDISPISEMDLSKAARTSGPAIFTAPPSPFSWADATNDSLSNISSRRESGAPAHLLEKPLPLPPTMVHAVSTADDSALPLRTAPLPQLPHTPSPSTDEISGATASQPIEQLSANPHRASLRHVQTFPSGKAMRRSQSSGEIPFGITAATFALVSPVTQQIPKPKKRTSIGIKKIEIEDWEDAIDYSWDHPPDVDDEFESELDQAEPLNHNDVTTENGRKANPQPRSSRPTPLPLAPVMEHEASDDQHIDLPLLSPTTGRSDEAGFARPLQGLGIEAHRPPTTIHVDADRFLDHLSQRESLRIPVLRREPGSPISKSSSQESIILSIASSIMGTQRSSNSSTSLSDMSHLANVEDDVTSPLVDAMRRADSVEGSASDGSQETVTTEPCTASTPSTEFPSPPTTKTLPTSDGSQRGPSISRVQVPNRTSSIVAASTIKSPPSTTRQRSNTLNGRPKNVRVSYSLFPTPQPPPPLT